MGFLGCSTATWWRHEGYTMSVPREALREVSEDLQLELSTTSLRRTKHLLSSNEATLKTDRMISEWRGLL